VPRSNMRIQDLHILPKFGDGWSYLYVEHCRVDQEDRAIAVHDVSGKVPVPCANLALLMLGPGVSITHAAISVLADHGCMVAWCGEEGVRFYALGMGETRSAANFLLRLTIRSLMMVVLILERVSPGLRGELTRWFLEPQAGVFVGRISAAVRERLWEKACSQAGEGGCLIIHSTDNEQGYNVRTWGRTARSIEDFEGLFLVRVP